jgi:dihydroorotase
MYDLLIKGGEVIDPSQGIHGRQDIGISNGRIAAVNECVDPKDAKRFIDATGKIVTPGLIDLHAHVAHGIVKIGLLPDVCGVETGVTTVCDAGSTGYLTFANFKHTVLPVAKTDVFCFLNLCPNGLKEEPEAWNRHPIDHDAIVKTFEENGDVVKGLKLRVTATMSETLGIDGVKRAKQIAKAVKVPLMVHIGIDLSEQAGETRMDHINRQMLDILEAGDILTHVYTAKIGSVIKPDGYLLPGLKEAIERGVLLDTAIARFNYSIGNAKIGLEQGVIPYTVSTDLTSISINESVFSLLTTMSKFLTIGLSLDELIRMTTIHPARVLGQENQRGSLSTGFAADISIVEMKEGDYTFKDGVEGKTFYGNRMLTPVMTLKSGEEIPAKKNPI